MQTLYRPQASEWRQKVAAVAPPTAVATTIALRQLPFSGKLVFSFEKMVFKEKYQCKVTIATRIALRQLHSAPLSVSLSYGFKNLSLNVKQCLVPKIVFTYLKRLIMSVEGRSKKQNKIKTMVLK